MALSAILTIQNGIYFGNEVNVTSVTREKPSYIIGNNSRAHLNLNDPSVGSSHAAIVAQGDEYRIKSTLPAMRVYVNGKLVERAQTLYPGDVIRVGDTELYFDLVERDLS